MTRCTRFFAVLIALLVAVNLSAQEAPDTVLLNGKIVTVDDYFSIEEAVAISGERIVAVGTDAAVRALAGPGTIVVDLDGRTVIPGLIDNHNHIIRATEYWPNEARLDGVTNRFEALARSPKANGSWRLVAGPRHSS
jgi:predicted amidohydrolase YtcJ